MIQFGVPESFVTVMLQPTGGFAACKSSRSICPGFFSDMCSSLDALSANHRIASLYHAAIHPVRPADLRQDGATAKVH